MDGFEFARTVRGLNKSIPILFMSARDDLPAKQRGFDLGIDDYMIKPVDFSELLMRVGALLRRSRIEANRQVTVGNLILNADALSAEVDGEEIPVTTREFNILYKLLSYPNHTFSRSQLMDEFWGVESDTSLRADVAVYQYGPNTGHRVTVGSKFGHEAVCRVAAVGEKVTNFMLGRGFTPILCL